MIRRLFKFMLFFIVFGLVLFHVFSSNCNDSKYCFSTSLFSAKDFQISDFPKPKLEPCPDDPPDLVGPLKVKLSPEITLEVVKKEVEPNLQIGGRYKPPNCTSQHKVAVIIPFRNRYDHLKYWLYYLHPILKRQQLDYGVYVINQDGDGVFNRAKLMNIGYVEALKEYDYNCFVFSDVDLIPMNDRNIYKCFSSPRHLSVAVDKFNFKLPYRTVFGGVTSLSKDQFVKVNGFSNTFWGWGGEDDDMFNRVTYHKMKISRPDFLTGRYKMIYHERDLHNEANPEHNAKLGKTKKTMSKDGLNSLRYNVTDFVKVRMCTFITVDVFGPKSINVTKKGQ